jgi:hypothetical protein
MELVPREQVDNREDIESDKNMVIRTRLSSVHRELFLNIAPVNKPLSSSSSFVTQLLLPSIASFASAAR